jgi:hypothetical protein
MSFWIIWSLKRDIRSVIRLDAMKPCTRGWASAEVRSWGKNDGETKSLVEMSKEAALSLFKMLVMTALG